MLVENCTEKASYLREKLLAIPGVEMRFPGRHFFNEFVVKTPVGADRLIRRLIEQGQAAGFPLGRYYDDMDHCLMVAVTEKRTKQEIDYFAHVMENAIQQIETGRDE